MILSDRKTEDMGVLINPDDINIEIESVKKLLSSRKEEEKDEKTGDSAEENEEGK